MAKTLETPKPTYQFSVQCDVLPIVRLTRWSAQAGELLAQLDASRQACPEFDRLCKRKLGGVVTPDIRSSTELVAEALSCVENLLELFTDSYGGDI